MLYFKFHTILLFVGNDQFKLLNYYKFLLPKYELVLHIIQARYLQRRKRKRK